MTSISALRQAKLSASQATTVLAEHATRTAGQHFKTLERQHRVKGKVAPLIEVGAGSVSSLTGRENIYLKRRYPWHR
ncbi:MAG: hypothetical protein IPN81_14270 [Nitrosomonadales bacterium]|nr:hypothetical protein [Nitrosomonadales bacterium]